MRTSAAYHVRMRDTRVEGSDAQHVGVDAWGPAVASAPTSYCFMRPAIASLGSRVPIAVCDGRRGVEAGEEIQSCAERPSYPREMSWGVVQIDPARRPSQTTRVR